MTDGQQEQPDPAAYTRGERIAGIIGVVFFGLLVAIAFDLATGGRALGWLGDQGGGDEPA